MGVGQDKGGRRGLFIFAKSDEGHFEDESLSCEWMIAVESAFRFAELDDQDWELIVTR
jgi:hypothetical protein